MSVKAKRKVPRTWVEVPLHVRRAVMRELLDWRNTAKREVMYWNESDAYHVRMRRQYQREWRDYCDAIAVLRRAAKGARR